MDMPRTNLEARRLHYWDVESTEEMERRLEHRRELRRLTVSGEFAEARERRLERHREQRGVVYPMNQRTTGNNGL